MRLRPPARPTLALLLLAAFLALPQTGAADPTSWQAAELSLPQAWQITKGGPGAVVAIVDTGVQADVPALAGHVLPGWNLVANDGDTIDDNGHGTALAGIVLATCPGCDILPVKVLGADMTGTWPTVAAGIVWAADHGAKVINLSFGAPRAIDAVGAAVAYARAKGAVVVAAAGNDGLDEAFYPAAYEGVVSVAGVDQDGALYPWSDFGSGVTIAAPGCAASGFCGTSAAAPFVSGVAGLAFSLRPSLTPAQLASAMAASGDPLPDASATRAGRVDAARLLAALTPARDMRSRTTRSH